MKQQLCQSCAADIVEHKLKLGTNSDGTLNEDYCHHCYANGKFTDGYTMNQMIDHWVVYLINRNPSLTEDAAREQMNLIIPKLKRWSA